MVLCFFSSISDQLVPEALNYILKGFAHIVIKVTARWLVYFCVWAIGTFPLYI